MRKPNPPPGVLGWAWGIGPETIRFAKRQAAEGGEVYRAAGTAPMAWRLARAEAGMAEAIQKV